MIIYYFLVLSVALFSLGLAGALGSRHVILVIISAEIVLVASTLLGIGMFSSYGGDIVPLLFSIWGVAASEIIALVVFYIYMSRYEDSMDVTRLSRLRE